LTRLYVSDHRRINFLNVYGPCFERKCFREKVEGMGLLAKGDMVIVGDLNLTSTVDEVWEATTLYDPLALFFKEMFCRIQLIDIFPAEITPTWRNGRYGVDEILQQSGSDLGKDLESTVPIPPPIVANVEPIPKPVASPEPLTTNPPTKTYADACCSNLRPSRVVASDPVLDNMINTLVSPIREITEP